MLKLGFGNTEGAPTQRFYDVHTDGQFDMLTPPPLVWSISTTDPVSQTEGDGASAVRTAELMNDR